MFYQQIWARTSNEGFSRAPIKNLDLACDEEQEYENQDQEDEELEYQEQELNVLVFQIFTILCIGITTQ